MDQLAVLTGGRSGNGQQSWTGDTVNLSKLMMGSGLSGRIVHEAAVLGDGYEVIHIQDLELTAKGSGVSKQVGEEDSFGEVAKHFVDRVLIAVGCCAGHSIEGVFMEQAVEHPVLSVQDVAVDVGDLTGAEVIKTTALPLQ